MAPGTYQARVVMANLDEGLRPSGSSLGRLSFYWSAFFGVSADRYSITLWPGPARPLTVTKQRVEPAAQHLSGPRLSTGKDVP